MAVGSPAATVFGNTLQLGFGSCSEAIFSQFYSTDMAFIPQKLHLKSCSTSLPNAPIIG